MSVSLNPVTQQKLDQFERRRRQLVLTRGVCAGLFSFLLMMTLIATADWLWVLPGSARWTMSLAGYLGTGLVVWLTCLRLLVRIPSREELAQFVEMTKPELREQLLSAIELCADDPSRVHDSPVFRQLLQDRVGRQMESVDVSRLLPLKLLARWMMASVAIVAVFFLLLSLPGFPFRQLMTRAILPGANLDRVSRVRVTILQPTPHSLTLPRDETLAVVVELTGGNVDEATLETRTSSGEVLRQPMRVHGPMQFAANIAVEEESIEYRILAGDAVTRRYTIRSRMRPHVISYHKTYRPPEYTRLGENTTTEAHGDLIALEGTQAEVVFELDQPVAEAELRLERSGSDEIEVVTLSPDGPFRYRAEMPITEPAIYKVHLVGKETGFDNPFSPKNEIRPEPDLVPRVGFVDIEEPTLLLPPNDILDLEGLAEDDLPLVSLEQQISVNGREWLSVPLAIDEEARVTVDWQWDMLALDLKSGDQVTTKLVATDRKGNEGESIPLQIVISSPDFDPDRHTVMELKGDLYDVLAELAESVALHTEAAKEILTKLRENPTISEIPDADRSVLLDLAHKVREEADRATTLTLELLPGMPAGADAEELELVARLVARIRSDHMRIPATFLDLSRNPDVSTATNEDLKRVADAFDQATDDSQHLRESYCNLLTHNILAAIAADLHGVQKYQARLLESTTPLSWERLHRHEAVVLNQLRVVEQLTRSNASRMHPKMVERLVRYLRWINETRVRLEDAMESEDQWNQLQETAHRLAKDLPEQQRVAVVDGNLPRALLSARRELAKRSGSLSKPIHHLAETSTQIKSHTAELSEADDSTQTRELQTSIERAVDQLERFGADGVERLASRRTATQARPDADTQFASDAGLTRRAVTNLSHRFAQEPVDQSEIPEILGQVAHAYLVLETGHEASQLNSAVEHLLSLERWDSQTVSARLDHPRQWDAITDGCDRVAKSLLAAKYPREIVSRIDRLRSSRSAQEAGSKIGGRRGRYENHVAAAYELAEMKTELDETLEEIQPIMDEARALIAQYAPTLSEMARQAAEELRDLEEKTDKTADNLVAAEPEAASEQMNRVETRQEEVNRQLDDLLDALVEDANQQDLMTDEGRERARDADDSMHMIEEPAAEMNQAMEQAATAHAPEEQARELSQAADQQHRTADALDKIAEHYERVETGEDLADTREALRQAEREMGIARQMDQQYASAEELAEMAAKTPEDLMAELEAELAQNPAMQETLSEITQDALAQAKNSLEHSAEREADMERSLEKSDQDFREKKQALTEELRELGRMASELANRQVNQAETFASQGRDQQAQEQFHAVRNKLYHEFSKAQHAHQDAALEDLLDMARQTADQAEELAEQLRQGEQSTARAKDEDIYKDEKRRAERQAAFEKDQKRFHDQMVSEAKKRAQERSRDEQRVKQQVDREKRDLQNAQQNVDKQHELLRRDPSKDSAKRAVQEAEKRRDQAQQELDRAERTQQRAQQRREQAERAAEQIAKKELKPLTAPNPAAELANRHAQEAAEIAEQMASRARRLAEQPDWANELAPEQGTLNQAREQQESVGQDVDQAGEDVARASRHEARLEKADLAQHLSDRAVEIQAVAAGEVSWSEQELEEAAEEADPESGTGQGNRQAMEAHTSIDVAEEAISEQAEALEATLTPPEAASQMAEAGQPSNDSPTSSQGDPSASQATPQEAAHAQMLARTLDALDQAMANSPSTPGMPGAPQPTPSALAQAAQTQASKMAQARMRARKASPKPGQEGAEESKQGAMLVDQGGLDATLPPVGRAGDEWGKLRAKSAEDAVGSGRDAVSAEYRKQVETYFRVIAERARKKK
jgi:hypothetical protein